MPRNRLVEQVKAVGSGLGKHAKREAKTYPKGPRRLSEREQLERFLLGQEKPRLERGEITAQQYNEYRAAMVKKLREKVGV